MMTISVLAVPMRVNALVADEEKSVIGAIADFAELPYQDSQQIDRYADNAYLISSVARRPFNNVSTLPTGVHLHWRLPQAMTSGSISDGNISMPTVPNRWLVIRTDADGINEKKWVVESDYLYPVGTVPERAVCIPHDRTATGDPPYRFIGRQVEFSKWQAETTTHDYYSDLHALGWGTPYFSAHYGECFSIFGFYDSELATAEAVAGYTYQVIGWYSDTNDDYFAQYIISEVTDDDTVTDLAESIANWSITDNDTADNYDADSISQMICFAKVTFADSIALEDGIDATDTTLAIARNGYEAASTYLSKAITEEYDLTIDEAIRIENQLQAVLFTESVQGENVDFINRLKNARHRSCFRQIDAGVSWAFIDETTLTADTDTTTQDELESAVATVKEEKASALVQLNILQDRLNRLGRDIEIQKSILYADWTKYMLALYPTDRLDDDQTESDTIKNFINTKTLPQLELMEESYTVLEAKITAMTTTSDDFLLDNSTYGISSDNSTTSLLRQVPATRYWAANPPSLLIEGGVAGSTTAATNGSDILACQIVTIATDETDIDNWMASDEATSSIGLDYTISDLACTTWEKQPWLPLCMEWRMALYPDEEASSNVEGNLEPYNSDFITSNYRIALNDEEFSLPSSGVDLQPRNPVETIAMSASANIVTGRSLLTFEVTNIINSKLSEYVTEQLEEGSYSDLDDYVAQNFSEDATTSDKCLDATYSIGVAQEVLTATSCLTQRIDGLHDEWLMQRTGVSLSVEDPLRFIFTDDNGDDQSFSAQIASKLGDSRYKLPAPYQRFTPIRSGINKILNVRLIDTFGRFKDLPCDDVLRPQREVASGTVYQPPRVIQPTRLKFSWRMNSALDNLTTPVHGWLVYNIFDETLMIFDAEGEYLGAVNSDGEWEAEIGEINQSDLSNISNATLKKFVMKLLSFHSNNRIKKETFTTILTGTTYSYSESDSDNLWDDLVDAGILQTYNDGEKAYCISTQDFDDIGGIDSDTWLAIRSEATNDNANYFPNLKKAIRRAQDNIEPETSNADQISMAMPPLAVVRATVDLQLYGMPQISKSWTALINDFGQNTRSRRNFTDVQFPIKIGEYNNLDDGLVCYWQEGTDGELSATGYFPQSDMDDAEDFIDSADFDQSEYDYIDAIRDEGVANLSQSFADAPIRLLMLVAPDAPIHAVTGIVPREQLLMEPSMYEDALENIQLSYFAAPLLTPTDRFSFPMPASGSWQWTQWMYVVDKTTFLNQTDVSDDDWDDLVSNNLIYLYDESYAIYYAVDDDNVPTDLQNNWTNISTAITNSKTNVMVEIPGVSVVDKNVFLDYLDDEADSNGYWSDLEAMGIVSLYDDPRAYYNPLESSDKLDGYETLSVHWDEIKAALKAARIPVVQPTANVPTLVAPVKAIEGWLRSMPDTDT